MSRQTTRLEVVAQGAKWMVRELGIGRLSSHATLAEASAAARRVAADNTPCELVIKKADGTTDSEQTFR
jgi:hypothetical protein